MPRLYKIVPISESRTLCLNWILPKSRYFHSWTFTLISFCIEDEGPGFSEKNIAKVFNRFYSNRPENFGEHSGLGLNIVKNIIELHGGSILASNQSGNKRGAKIEVLLPIYK